MSNELVWTTIFLLINFFRYFRAAIIFYISVVYRCILILYFGTEPFFILITTKLYIFSVIPYSYNNYKILLTIRSCHLHNLISK